MSATFISYSRNDSNFVQHLAAALKESYGDVWVDQQSLMPASSWRQEIVDAITAADNLLFILSPNSLASPVCAQEVNLAIELKKRIIPIVIADVNPQQIPPDSPLRALAEINWTFMRPQDNFSAAYQQLMVALTTDLEYWHEASRLLTRAQQWKDARENGSFALRGKELADAEAWLTEGTSKKPTPTPLHAQFIAFSRRVASRQQRRVVSLLTTGLIITLTLAIISSALFVKVNGQNIVINQQVASLRIKAIAARANTVLDNNQIDQALLMSVFASRQQDSYETRRALDTALDAHPNLAAILDNGGTHIHTQSSAFSSPLGANVQYSADGKTLLFAYAGGVEIFDMPAGHLRFPPITNSLVILNAVLSPNGKLIAIQQDSGTYTIMDATDGKRIEQFTDAGAQNDYNPNVHGFAFSLDSRIFAATICPASGCSSHLIVLWDVATHTVIGQLTLNSTNQSDEIALAFSADSQRLAASECSGALGAFFDCDDSWVTEWNLAARTQVFTHHFDRTTQGSALTLAFSPDGKTLAVGGKAAQCLFPCARGQLILADAMTLTIRYMRVESLGLVAHLAYTGDGQVIVATAGDNDLRLWNATTAIPISTQPIATIGSTNGSGVTDVATSPDGRYFVTSDLSERLLQWRILPHSDLGLPVGPLINGTSSAIFTPDGKYVVTSSPKSLTKATSDGKLYFWDLASRRVVMTLTGPIKDSPNAELFSPNGQILASGYDSGQVVLWNMRTRQVIGSPLFDPQPDAVFNNIASLAFSPDGTLLAATDFTDRTEVWNVQTGKLVHDFSRDEEKVSSLSAVFLDNHTLVLGIGDGSADHPYQLAFANLERNKAQFTRKLTGEQHQLVSILYNASNRTIVTADINSAVALWNLDTGKIEHRFVISLDRPNDTQLIGIKTFPGVQLITVGANHQQEIIATSSTESVALDPATLLPVSQPSVEAGQILSVAESSDHSYLVIAIAQGPLRTGTNPVVVRNLNLDALQQQACAIAHRNLTPQEWNDLIGSEYAYQKLCPQYP